MYGARQEFTILQEPGVIVTSARFIVGQQTYPMAGLTAVAPFTDPPSTIGSIVGTLCVGGLAAISGLAAYFAGSGLGFGVTGLLGAAATVILVLGMMKKPMHGVRIATAGGQVHALFSRDIQHVQRVVGALNQALSMR